MTNVTPVFETMKSVVSQGKAEKATSYFWVSLNNQKVPPNLRKFNLS